MVKYVCFQVLDCPPAGVEHSLRHVGHVDDLDQVEDHLEGGGKNVRGGDE